MKLQYHSIPLPNKKQPFLQDPDSGPMKGICGHPADPPTKLTPELEMSEKYV